MLLEIRYLLAYTLWQAFSNSFMQGLRSRMVHWNSLMCVCVCVCGLGERLGLLGIPGSAHTHRKRVRVHAGGNCRAWQAMAKHEATTTVLGYMRSGALSNDTLLRYSAR